METYKQLKDRQQKEFNELPIKFAFNDKQFNEGMEALGLKPTDTDKVASLGYGGFYKLEDSKLIYDTIKRHAKEQNELKQNDELLLDMFKYEMANHEYSYTNDDRDTLEACGYREDEIAKDERALKIWEQAKAEYLKESYESEE